MSDLTANKNYLSPVGFRLSIDNDLKNTVFFCTAANLPSLSLPEAVANYQRYGQAFPGERIQYDPLEVRFIVDENMVNYNELYQWMHIAASTATPMFKDVTLSILSSHNNPVKQIRFISAFPTNLNGLEFDTTQSQIEYMTCACTLRYTRFEFLK